MSSESTHNTILRQLAMLRLIPKHPRKIAVSDLRDKLAERGYPVTRRTIERDLLSLAGMFGLVRDDEKPAGWSFLAREELILIPSLDPQSALTFKLVEFHLAKLLPRPTLSALNPYFKAADGVLSAHGPLSRWKGKVRILPRGQALIPPKIDGRIQGVVYDALLEEKRLSFRYKPRGQSEAKEYEASPLGLVVRDQLIYLLCTCWEYEDARQFALHRIEAARILEKPASQSRGFTLDQYIAEGGFGYPVSDKPIRLKVRMTRGAALHLHESPLAEDQRLTGQGEEHELLTATVLDTAELRWWLLGFGDGVEVLAPAHLRREFSAIATAMAGQYA